MPSLPPQMVMGLAPKLQRVLVIHEVDSMGCECVLNTTAKNCSDEEGCLLCLHPRPWAGGLYDVVMIQGLTERSWLK